MSEKRNLLVTSSSLRGGYEELEPFARIYMLDRLGEAEIDEVLPSIDCVLVQGWWPDALTPERIRKMSRLRFVQSGMAGVNHIPFRELPAGAVVSSNAGGFSSGVAEFAFALLLAGSKRVVALDRALRSEAFDQGEWRHLFREIKLLRGKTLGILGYGGIGAAVGAMGRAFGMDVVAFSRHPRSEGGVEVLQGADGLRSVLQRSDAVVIALPLSKLTAGMIGAPQLEAMKPDAVLVNVARAEIVDDEAVYRHLERSPQFTYATDVWEIERGKETYKSRFPFLKLPNFIGTPHVAGGSSALTGEPGRVAVDNVLRYLRGEAPANVVDPSEYV